MNINSGNFQQLNAAVDRGVREEIILAAARVALADFIPGDGCEEFAAAIFLTAWVAEYDLGKVSREETKAAVKLLIADAVLDVM